MTRKTPISYDNLILGSQHESTAEPLPEAPHAADATDPVQEAAAEIPRSAARRAAPARAPAPPPDSKLLRDVAQQFVIYLHPAAHKTIARYALEQSSHRNKVRPHDIIIEAIEDYFQRHGLQGPVRAKPKAG